MKVNKKSLMDIPEVRDYVDSVTNFRDTVIIELVGHVEIRCFPDQLVTEMTRKHNRFGIQEHIIGPATPEHFKEGAPGHALVDEILRLAPECKPVLVREEPYAILKVAERWVVRCRGVYEYLAERVPLMADFPRDINHGTVRCSFFPQFISPREDMAPETIAAHVPLCPRDHVLETDIDETFFEEGKPLSLHEVVKVLRAKGLTLDLVRREDDDHGNWGKWFIRTPLS